MTHHPSRSTLCPFAYDFTDELTDVEEKSFARGAFSFVYRGKVKDKEVAIKTVQNEYDVWQHLRHPNILQLEGICFFHTEKSIPSFVTAFQRNGQISSYVLDRPQFDVIYALERIAMAIDYLHSNDVIHNDIRAANILISNTEEPLLSDFGLAKHVKNEEATTSELVPGNSRWMAHELFNSSCSGKNALRTKESDVWSFAMTIMEILTGKVPYHDRSDTQAVSECIEKGELPTFPSPQHDRWKDFEGPINRLCRLCWALEPEYRLTANELIFELRSIRTKSGKIGEMVSKAWTPYCSPRHTPRCSTIRSYSSREQQSGEPMTALSERLSASSLDPKRNRLEGSEFSIPFVNSPQEIETSSLEASFASRHASISPISNASASYPSSSPGAKTYQTNTSILSNAAPISRASSSSPRQPSSFARTQTQSDSIPTEFLTDPSVELQNFLARKGVSDMFHAKQKELHPGGPWYTKLYFNGEEVGQGSGTKKTTSFSAAAKIALPKIRASDMLLANDSDLMAHPTVANIGRICEATRPQSSIYSGFTTVSSDILSRLKEDYKFSGLDHSLNWFCIFRVGGQELCRGQGKTKKEARQNARLNFRYAICRSPASISSRETLGPCTLELPV